MLRKVSMISCLGFLLLFNYNNSWANTITLKNMLIFKVNLKVYYSIFCSNDSGSIYPGGVFTNGIGVCSINKITATKILPNGQTEECTPWVRQMDPYLYYYIDEGDDGCEVMSAAG